jgi:hypothetical protein
MPVADWKTFKIYGKIWLWKKKIIRISYQKAHHFPASCVLCKFLRFNEKEKKWQNHLLFGFQVTVKYIPSILCITRYK